MSILRFPEVETITSGGPRVDYMPSEAHFEPHNPRYGPFLVWGCVQPITTGSGSPGALFEAFLGHIVELEGTK